mmetsp:Transcript_113979/g.322365  ORF Transcript_113979/g.322365 Transcript_113979/m.322365 type:complete len:246 (+) Transcript_113979:454-1191(+)
MLPMAKAFRSLPCQPNRNIISIKQASVSPMSSTSGFVSWSVNVYNFDGDNDCTNRLAAWTDVLKPLGTCRFTTKRGQDLRTWPGSLLAGATFSEVPVTINKSAAFMSSGDRDRNRAGRLSPNKVMAGRTRAAPHATQGIGVDVGGPAVAPQTSLICASTSLPKASISTSRLHLLQKAFAMVPWTLTIFSVGMPTRCSRPSTFCVYRRRRRPSSSKKAKNQWANVGFQVCLSVPMMSSRWLSKSGS